MERLDKVLAGTGRWSRREVKDLVRQGRVRIDGMTARTAEEKLDPDAAAISVDGQPVETERFTYVMLHKPAGVLSATEDSRQSTVLDLLPPELRKRGLSPVGRLDKDTEGLLLLTNDGDLAHRILSPRSGVWKTYYAEHEGTASAEDCAAFEAGLTLGDGTKCLPARLEPQGHGKSLIHVQEGKYHQVRRMMAARGMPVTYLKRIAEGGLTLGGLEKGAVAELDVV